VKEVSCSVALHFKVPFS